MKIKELMIGDWLQYYDCNLKKQCYAQVTSIQADGAEHFVQTSDSDIYYLVEEYKPIPLTGAILQRNGFVYLPAEVTLFGATEHFDDAYILKVEDRQITIQGYSDFLHRVTFSNTANNIGWFDMGAFRHVHELQHALRLCGMNDLADNFII